ncbi:hypothetical protein MA16_Dca001127 [Dendrobium catenatum]|uniref:Uncharacterized protein n=1 Tax=Dendrobium catenatum TaxID=906689 RepID=A0A2I0WLI6_9ASPA|nr:hypothetical protein MA16_Dca001127 [Dendrobium catenatum]
MSSVCFEVPNGWRCEECLRSAEAVSKRHLPAHQFSHNRTWRKIEAGKVKFITNEEVVTLTSWKRSHGRGNPSACGHRSDFAYVKPPSISRKTVAPTLLCSNANKTHFTPKKGSVSDVIDIKPSEHTMASKPVSKEKGKTTAQVFKMEPVVGKASTLACNVSSKPSEVIFDTVDTLHADDGQISMVDKHIGTAENSSKKMLLPLKLVISSDEKLHHAVEACWRRDDYMETLRCRIFDLSGMKNDKCHPNLLLQLFHLEKKDTGGVALVERRKRLEAREERLERAHKISGGDEKKGWKEPTGFPKQTRRL